MIINKKEISLDEALKISDYENLLVKRRNNGIFLSDYQVSVLNRNNIDYNNFGNIQELLFEIENCLAFGVDYELDMVGAQLAEYIYYNETKK